MVFWIMASQAAAQSSANAFSVTGSPSVSESPPVSISSDHAREATQWLVGRLSVEIPKTIQGEKDWGKTKSIWSGIHVRRDGWQLRTHRNHRDVNHGRWVRYQLEFPETAEPAKGGLIQIRSVSPVALPSSEQSGAAAGGWRIASIAETPLFFSVRVERWNLGVQWFSVEVKGRLHAKLDAQAVLAARPDYSEVPPAIAMHLQVEQAFLTLTGFEVTSISKLGGDVAEEIGDLAEKILRDVWLQKENERLASRLNRVIAKHQKDMRWSASDWLKTFTTDRSAGLPASH